MTKNYQKYLYIIGLCFIIFSSIYAGSKHMNVDLMEARNFVTAREMIQNDNWLLPTMNGEPRLAKPPLPTWGVATAMQLAASDTNLLANRLPAGFAALLMVFFIYGFVRRLSGSRDIGIYSAVVLSTSYMFMYMARKGTWDIFAHSFMLGAIWMYHETIIAKPKSWLTAAAAGILMGLSWMSKGPVSFYALLLPFIISHIIFYREHYRREHLRPIMAMFGICAVISASWPLYVYFHMPAQAQTMVHGEAIAWFSRHIKPFWYYLQFPAMSGIWVFILLPMLWPPYASKKIENLKIYKMMLLWTILMVILLAVIPEKKDRYLLPVTIPLSVIIAYYVRYLVNAFKREKLRKDDKVVINIYVIISAILSVMVTASAAYEFMKSGFSDNTFIFFIIALAANYTTYRSLRVRSGSSYVNSIVITFLVLINVMPPLAQKIAGEKDFMYLQELRPVLAESHKKVYSYEDNMKLVWAAGHNLIKSPIEELGLKKGETVLYLSNKPLTKSDTEYDLKEIKALKGNKDKVLWQLYQLSN